MRSKRWLGLARPEDRARNRTATTSGAPTRASNVAVVSRGSEAEHLRRAAVEAKASTS